MVGGNDYLIQVKGNSKRLLDAIRDYSATHKASSRSQSVDHARGRKEYRQIRAFTNLPSEIFPKGWHGINTIIHARFYGRRGNRKYKKDHYYICSISKIKAYELADCIRSHWQIENNLHWVKDSVMYEDKSRIKGHNLAAILSVFRISVLNIYRINNQHSITKAIEKFSNRIVECLRLIDISYA